MNNLNPVTIQQTLERHAWKPNFQPASNREWWDATSQRIDPETRASIIARAEQFLDEPPVFMPASLYLKFRNDGDRKEYEALIHRRGEALAAFTLAECLENSGRYLTALQDYVWATCEQSTWSYPAHHRDLPDPAKPHIDLGVAMLGLTLSEISLLLGDQFEPAVTARIRAELDQRLWQPYLNRHDFFWMFNSLDRQINNWTAVCTAGVVGSAINLNVEPARLAEMIDRALHSLTEYLATFDPDGGSTEGPGYWDYGFGYYSIIGQILAQRTGNVIDLFDRPEIGDIARFPLRTRLSEGRYVPFSDCALTVQMEPALLELLAQRLDLPELRSLTGPESSRRLGVRGFTWLLRDLAWRDPAVERPEIAAPRHVWFSGMHWMISRDDPADPATLVLAIKGGHNNEMHNQNDIGSFVVHIAGESLIADVGRGKYTRQYFGPERYQFIVNNSRGHSVPVVASLDQPAGDRSYAEVIAHTTSGSGDWLVLDMKNAYPPEAGLATLERTAILDRDHHRIELTDRFAFLDGARPFESVLITLFPVQIDDGLVTIQGDRNTLHVRFDTANVQASEEIVRDVDLDGFVADIHRIVLSPREPRAEGEIALVIERAG